MDESYSSRSDPRGIDRAGTAMHCTALYIFNFISCPHMDSREAKNLAYLWCFEFCMHARDRDDQQVACMHMHISMNFWIVVLLVVGVQGTNERASKRAS
jgi:hypothetical protein